MDEQNQLNLEASSGRKAECPMQIVRQQFSKMQFAGFVFGLVVIFMFLVPWNIVTEQASVFAGFHSITWAHVVNKPKAVVDAGLFAVIVLIWVLLFYLHTHVKWND